MLIVIQHLPAVRHGKGFIVEAGGEDGCAVTGVLAASAAVAVGAEGFPILEEMQMRARQPNNVAAMMARATADRLNLEGAREA